jgi:hypothetical protein
LIYTLNEFHTWTTFPNATRHQTDLSKVLQIKYTDSKERIYLHHVSIIYF